MTSKEKAEIKKLVDEVVKTKGLKASKGGSLSFKDWMGMCPLPVKAKLSRRGNYHKYVIGSGKQTFGTIYDAK